MKSKLHKNKKGSPQYSKSIKKQAKPAIASQRQSKQRNRDEPRKRNGGPQELPN